MNDRKNTKCIIPCRLAYLNCFTPLSINEGTPKYSVCLIIKKNDLDKIHTIEEAIENAKKVSLSKWGGEIPKDLKSPLRDGDLERPDDEAFSNSYFINCHSTYPPQVVDTQVEPIRDRSKIYSGCYGNVSVNFYGYNFNKNSGIAAGLGNIQLTRQGEPLVERASAKDEFEVIREENFLS